MVLEQTLTWTTLSWASVVVLIAVALNRQVLETVKQLVVDVSKSFFAFNMAVFTWYYNSLMYSKKKELFKTLTTHLNGLDGDILEVGAGTGANFQFFPDGCSVVALDPNQQMNSYLCRCKDFYPNVNLKDYLVGSGEDMGKIKDHSVSVVVTTLVLCSVESADQVLKEVIRVLKPGGRLYFLEHVKGKSWMLSFQKILDPFWYYCADGCRLTRDTESNVRKAGFKNVECQRFEASHLLPPVIKPHIMGYAET